MLSVNSFTIFKVKPPDSDEDEDDDSEDDDDGDMSGCADMDDVAADLRIHAKDEAAFAAFMTGHLVKPTK